MGEVTDARTLEGKGKDRSFNDGQRAGTYRQRLKERMGTIRYEVGKKTKGRIKMRADACTPEQ